MIEAVADDMLAVDHVGRANAFIQYRSMGVLTANEVRATMNRPPLPGGDELQNPFTTTSTQPAQVEDDEQPKDMMMNPESRQPAACRFRETCRGDGRPRRQGRKPG